MGIVDLLRKKPDPLLAWLKVRYGTPAMAHGRALSVRSERALALGLAGRQACETACVLKFVRPESFLSAAAVAALASLHDPDWRARSEEGECVAVGGGFALDTDFDLDSAWLRLHGGALARYLERLSASVRAVHANLPHLGLEVDPALATPRTLERDIETADALLGFFEQTRMHEGRDLWRHSSVAE
jgi:hypothetical protein